MSSNFNCYETSKLMEFINWCASNLSLSKEELNSFIELLQTRLDIRYSLLGAFAESNNKLDEAEKWFKKNLRISLKNKLRLCTVRSLIFLGALYQKKRKPKSIEIL